jgi:hypothetical protein
MIIKTTGVGSVPFDNISDAMHFVKECTIPYLPELKQENMLTLLDNPLYFEQENWKTFVKEVQTFKLVKVQITGPLTYQYFKKKFDHYEEKLIKAFDRIKNDLQNIPFILILDEPCLIKSSDRSKLKIVLDLLKYPEIGIHCCDHFKFSDVVNLPVKYLSFDASLFTDENLFELHKHFSLIIGANTDAMSRICDIPFKDYLISPPCGLKKLTLDIAKEIVIRPS